MLPVRQHLGEDLDGSPELLLRHRSEPGRSYLENQRVLRVAGSESDPWSFAGCCQRPPAGCMTFHTYNNPHLGMSKSP